MKETVEKANELVKAIRCEIVMLCHYSESEYHEYFLKDCEGCPFDTSWQGSTKDMLEQAANLIESLTGQLNETKELLGVAESDLKFMAEQLAQKDGEIAKQKQFIALLLGVDGEMDGEKNVNN